MREMVYHKWTHFNETEKIALAAQGFRDPRPPSKGSQNFHCDKCSKVFNTKASLQQHASVHLDRSEKPRYLCDVCGVETTTQRGITLHRLRNHDPEGLKEKMKQCPICPRQFLIKTHLTIHMTRFHGGEKKYECETCKMKFPTTYDLRRHIPSHKPLDWSMNIFLVIQFMYLALQVLNLIFFCSFLFPRTIPVRFVF